MDLNLKDKIFIVTGGAKGIGAAIVKAIAQEGGVPIILDRDEEAAEMLLEGLDEIKDSTFFFHKVDLCDTNDCEAVIAQIMEDCGCIDGLINNAGVNDGIGLENGSPEGFRKSFGKKLITLL